MKYLVFLTLFVITICSGCSDFTTSNTTKADKLLVLSGWLSPEQGAIISVTSTSYIDETYFETFKQADIKILRQDSLIATLKPNWDGDDIIDDNDDIIITNPNLRIPGTFIDTSMVLYNDATYRVEINVDGYKKAYTDIYIPKKTALIESVGNRTYDTLSVIDYNSSPPQRVYERSYAVYNLDFVSDISTGFYSIYYADISSYDNLIFGNAPSYMSFGFYDFIDGTKYGYFSGNKLQQFPTVDFAIPMISNNIYINVLSLNEETYLYQKKINEIDYADDSVYEEPTNYPSNIHNGLGFIGAYSVSQQIYIEDTFHGTK